MIAEQGLRLCDRSHIASVMAVTWPTSRCIFVKILDLCSLLIFNPLKARQETVWGDMGL
jgi:hypothetical protein